MMKALLHPKALLYRHLTRLGFFLFNLANWTRYPTTYEWIDSTFDSAPGPDRIKLDIWDPLASPKQSTYGATTALKPCVITLHSGGFVLGQATDDTLWANYVQDHLDAVVIGVNYRLAPEHRFPAAVEDVVDALVWVSQHAEDLGIDKKQIILTGFSAGGNLAITSLYLLHQVSQDPRVGAFDLCVRGIIAFYPTLDYSIPRTQKLATCSRPELCLPKHLIDLFHDSYIPSSLDWTDPRLSPGLASDDFLLTLPDIHLCLAEYDMLAQEALDFRDRMERLRPEKEVACTIAKGVQHAFDKPPRMRPRDEVWLQYRIAVDAMKRFLA